jgi:ribosomal protein S18 acetylase RimI-like enzyme
MYYSCNKQKKYILAFFAIAMTTGLFTLYFMHGVQGPIYDYDEGKDKAGIVALFEKDRYWLTSSSTTSIEHMLKYRSVGNSLTSRSQLVFKVLREDGKFAGFTAYFMKNKHVGQILFLAVDYEFRGKGYGMMLTKYAIKELKWMGAQEIILVTRTTNFPAQKVYETVGFRETSRDSNGYLYYAYTV